MTDLQQIAKAAQEIIQICEQERTSKADKERLLKLQGAILTHIEGAYRMRRLRINHRSGRNDDDRAGDREAMQRLWDKRNRSRKD